MNYSTLIEETARSGSDSVAAQERFSGRRRDERPENQQLAEPPQQTG